jgi:membrane protein DedA with SNARE-associated domain
LVDITDLFPFDESLGYLGLLGLSFFGSVIVFLPVPFIILLATMSLDPTFDPHLLALVSAAGATGGKMVVFYASYYGRSFLKDKAKRRMRPLQKLVSRYGWPATFIAASTPIPDDLVYIPLGLSRYNPLLFMTATFAGKIVLSEIVVWGAQAGSPLVQPLLENQDATVVYISAIVLTVVLAGIIYYTLKIDWTKSIGRWFPWTMEDDNEDGKEDKNGKPNDSAP